MRAHEFINIKELDRHLEEAINIMNPTQRYNPFDDNKDAKFRDAEFRFFRDQYKKWDKSRYLELFQLISSSLGYEHDRNFYRLYLPFDSSGDTTTKENQEVVQFIQSIGFDIVDYSKGIIQKKDAKGKVVQNKIQSVLSKYKKPELEKAFVKDQKESKSNEYSIVISRHAYDILGMSTDRDWSSCMKIGGHPNHCTYLPMDIKQGSIVAYLINSNDKNITNPLGRLTIRPYINSQGDVAFGNANKVYHTKLDTNMANKFMQELGTQLSRINQLQGIEGVFFVKPDLYPEGDDILKVRNPKVDKILQDILKNINGDYSKLKNYTNLDNNVKEALFDHDNMTIQYLDNLTIYRDVDLNNTDITRLPDNLTVNGMLSADYTGLTELPDNLTVNGSLSVANTPLTELPKNLNTKGLYLQYSKIRSLPDNLTIDGHLSISHTNIHRLPRNLKVNETIWIQNTNIRNIPRSLIVGGTIDGFFGYHNINYKNRDDEWIDELNTSRSIVDFEYKYRRFKTKYGIFGLDQDLSGDAIYILLNLKNKQLVEWAILIDPRIIKYLPPEHIDEKTLKILINKSGKNFKYLPSELKTLELCKLAVQQDGSALEYVPKELRTPELCKIAVLDRTSSLRYVPEDIRHELLDEISDTIVRKKGVIAYGDIPDYIWKEKPNLTKIAVEKALQTMNKDGFDDVDEYFPDDYPLKSFIMDYINMDNHK